MLVEKLSPAFCVPSGTQYEKHFYLTAQKKEDNAMFLPTYCS